MTRHSSTVNQVKDVENSIVSPGTVVSFGFLHERAKHTKLAMAHGTCADWPRAATPRLGQGHSCQQRLDDYKERPARSAVVWASLLKTSQDLIFEQINTTTFVPNDNKQRSKILDNKK